MSEPHLGIAGVGLIGGSIALRARDAYAGARITGYDADAEALGAARARGAIDAIAPDLAALAAQADILVLALPVDATHAALDILAGTIGPGLIIDVASVKAAFEAHAGRVINYVGTHPMAGRERSGVAAADPGLFAEATWAYVPNPDPALVERVRAFITAMGARPLEIDAVRHDEIVALTSHLPQALSVILGSELAGDATDPRVIELCGPGMMSMLRLARSPEAMWAPIFAANAAPLGARLRTIARALELAAAGLEEGDGALLMSYFRAARDVSVALEQRITPAARSSTYRCSQSLITPAPPPAR